MNIEINLLTERCLQIEKGFIAAFDMPIFHWNLFFGSAGIERRRTAHPKASIDERKEKYASSLWNFIGFVRYKSDAWFIKKTRLDQSLYEYTTG